MMKKFELDVAFEEGELQDLLVQWCTEMPELFIRIISLNGPAGGWPVIEVMMPEEQIGKFAKMYCEDDAKMWEEEFMHDVVSA